MNNATRVELALSARIAQAGRDDLTVEPYENVQTIGIWAKEGRTIIPNETPTMVEIWKKSKGKKKGDDGYFFRKTCSIFHECQTIADGESVPADHELLA